MALSDAAWLSMMTNSELESIVDACTESSRYSTFWVIAVGQAFLLRNCLQAELKNCAENSFSNTVRYDKKSRGLKLAA